MGFSEKIVLSLLCLQLAHLSYGGDFGHNDREKGRQVPCQIEYVERFSARVGKYDFFNPTELTQLALRTLRQFTGSSNQKLDNNTFKRVTDIIQEKGYIFDCHKVVSKDGYVTQLFRFKNGKNDEPGKYEQLHPMLFGHGLGMTGGDWLYLDNDRILPFMLADEGHDVWLLHTRGSKYSKDHVFLDPDNADYWDFSVHELGVFDLPVAIDYILNVTGPYSPLPKSGRTVNYIGYSLTTTMFHILMSERPEYYRKINRFISMAPAVFLGRSQAILGKILRMVPSDLLVALGNLIGNGQLLPPLANYILHQILPSVCVKAVSTFEQVQQFDAPEALFCNNLLFLLVGATRDAITKPVLQRLTGHAPQPISIRVAAHLFQFMKSPFQQYDYGPVGNLLKYQQLSPPPYNLSNTRVTMMVLYGSNDQLVNYRDVEYTNTKLINADLEACFVPAYNHLDFQLDNYTVMRGLYPFVREYSNL